MRIYKSVNPFPHRKRFKQILRNKSTLKRTVNNKIVKPVVISKRFIMSQR